VIDPASPERRVVITLPAYQRPWLLDGALRLVVQTPEGRATVPLTAGER
jgi:hypothetical protein